MPMVDDFDEKNLYSRNAVKKPSLLSDYYRVPGLNILPPTRGKFLTDLETNMAGDIEVSPMKASDELLLKNPDSLMSGAALEGLFASCLRGVKNPREISMPDIDIFLIAIRAATYGEKMNLDVVCPSCKNEYEYTCHLPTILSSMTFVDEDPRVELNDKVSVWVKPYTLYDASKIAFLAFEESRVLQSLDATTPDDEEGRRIRMDKMNNSMRKVNDLSQMILTNCVTCVSVPEGEVVDKKEISDFISNISKFWKEKIENRIQEMNQHGVDKSMHIACTNCQHEWDTQLEIDPTSFFDAGS